MWKVVVAPDKFRGSLTATEAADAMSRGVRRAHHNAQPIKKPMADGGEGTVEALVDATSGRYDAANVTGPLGAPVSAQFGWLGDGRTAVLEMANASGLRLVPLGQRDPGRSSTRGTGELVVEAVRRGATRILLGIGGSATNDGGAGFGQALGYKLLDRDGRELGPGGFELSRLAGIDQLDRDRSLDQVEILAACDVTNPLCGPNGASAIFGPQKGADSETIAKLDDALERFAETVKRDLGRSIRDQPGAGAAGGLGGGLLAFTQASLQPGISLVIEAVKLRNALEGADLCLTGEGAIDGTSAGGKTIVGVAQLARSLGCPTLAIAGTLGQGYEVVLDHAVDAVFSLCPRPITIDEAVGSASILLENAVEQVVRAFLAGRLNSPKASGGT